MPVWLVALRHALPWLAAPLYIWWRARDRVTLDDYAATPPPDAPTVRVVVPARNEARNIARCVASVLATTYPRLELVVVDDHSDDDTGTRASTAAAGDPRFHLVTPPPLPAGWMGKQWACATGAAAAGAHADVLLFADADTAHAPDLVPRMVTALRARDAALLSVAGTQEMGTAWEKLVQPQVFAVIAGRYGGADRVSRARHAVDKIANGQCLMMTRDAYERVGTHAAVRDVVVEDLKLAQRTYALGLSVHLVRGEDQLRTRMYTSLGELVAGWRKNVFAGGREAMPFGRLGQLLFPFLLVLPALAQLYPPARLLLAAVVPATIGPAERLGMWIALGATLAFWAAAYYRVKLSPLWALAFPAGAALYLVIALQAVARGQRVEWRGREYLSAVRPA
ncbi:glycosyl transferase [Gemmatimonadetes bacterium T265]|nr:glycosyl transferase [Gemmatimonadetes bacterium T265]